MSSSKGSSYRLKHDLRLHNWLVHRIHDAVLASTLQQYANGILLDIGCGEKPYRTMTKDLVVKHLGLDHPGSFHSKKYVDIRATAYETGLADESVDTILCTFVLEHLERPQVAVSEMARILKPGGHVILSAPLFWHLHEEPRDFFRYTKYGLAHLFETAGMSPVEINALSGFMVTFAQQLAYYLMKARKGIFKLPVAAIQLTLQGLALLANRFDSTDNFTWAYLIVAKKP